MAGSNVVELIVKLTDQTQQGARQVEQRLKTLEGAAGKVGTALLAGSAASGAFLYSATRLAARVETLGAVTVRLGRNVGKTEEEIRALEQSVKSQGITMQGSRQAIAKMIQANIDLASATDLASMAQNAAVIAGTDSTEAFDRLVNSIARGNIRMAATLGLQVNFQQGYVAMAKELDKTTLELTTQEKVQSRLNTILAAGVNIEGAYTEAMETAGKKVTSLNRHLEDSKVILGEALLPIYADAVDKITELLKGWQGMSEAQQASKTSMLITGTAIAGITGAAIKAIPAIISMGTAIVGLGAGIAIATGGITLLLGGLAAIIIKAKAATAAIRAAEGVHQDLTDEVIKGGKSYEDYNREFDLMLEQQGVAEYSVRKVTRAVMGHAEQVDLVTDGVVRLTEAQFEYEIRLAATIDIYKAAYGWSEQAAKGVETFAEASGEAAEVTDELKRQVEELAEAAEINVSFNMGDDAGTLMAEAAKLALGGAGLEGLTARIEADVVAAGGMTPELQDALMQGTALSLAMDVAIGEESYTLAQAQLRKVFELTPEEGKTLIDSMLAGIEESGPAFSEAVLGDLKEQLTLWEGFTFADWGADPVVAAFASMGVDAGAINVAFQHMPEEIKAALGSVKTLTNLGLNPAHSASSGILSDLDRMDGRVIKIYIDYIVRGDKPDTRASGGLIDPSKITLVGEAGPELIIGGVVIPAGRTRQMLQQGLRPEDGMRGGSGGFSSRTSGRVLRTGGGGGSGPSTSYNPMEGGGGSGPSVYYNPYDPSDPNYGGGGTAAAVASAASQTTQVISQAVETIPEETAVAVAAAIAPVVTAQTQQIAAQNARTAQQQQETLGTLREILEVLRDQGGADETSQAVSEALQKADFG